MNFKLLPFLSSSIKIVIQKKHLDDESDGDDVDVSDDSVAEDVDHDDQHKDAGNPDVSSFSCR